MRESTQASKKNFSAFRPRVVNLSEKSAWKIEGKVCVCVREMSGRTEEDFFLRVFLWGPEVGDETNCLLVDPKYFSLFFSPLLPRGNHFVFLEFPRSIFATAPHLICSVKTLNERPGFPTRIPRQKKTKAWKKGGCNQNVMPVLKGKERRVEREKKPFSPHAISRKKKNNYGGVPG